MVPAASSLLLLLLLLLLWSSLLLSSFWSAPVIQPHMLDIGSMMRFRCLRWS